MSSTCGLYYLPYTTGSKLNEDPFLLSSSQFSGICRSRRERRPCPTWPPANCDASSLWVRQCLWKSSRYIVIITPVDLFSVTSLLFASHLLRYDVNRPRVKVAISDPPHSPLWRQSRCFMTHEMKMTFSRAF